MSQTPKKVTLCPRCKLENPVTAKVCLFCRSSLAPDASAAKPAASAAVPRPKPADAKPPVKLEAGKPADAKPDAAKPPEGRAAPTEPLVPSSASRAVAPKGLAPSPKERPTPAASLARPGPPMGDVDPYPTKSITREMTALSEADLEKAAAQTSSPPPPAVSHVVARVDDPRAVAWLSCDPLPPIPLGLSPVVSIGRAAACELTLPHSSVSRVHAVIRVVGDELVLEDRSSYGTFVNAAKVTAGKIKPGDTISIGPYDIKVRAKTDIASVSEEEGGQTKPLGAAVRDHTAADAMTGRIENNPLTELLQGLEFNHKTGTLEVHMGSRRGVLVVFDGTPMYATFGKLSGEPAIHAMLRLSEGYYAFRKKVEAGDRNVQKNLTAILLDAHRVQDEGGEEGEAS